MTRKTQKSLVWLCTKLLPCQSLCMAGFVWRQGLRLSPEGHRALPFLVQRIAALNNSFLRNWTRVSCSGYVSVRLHTYSASWWAAQGAWAQFCRLVATAAQLGPRAGWWPRYLVCSELSGPSVSVHKQASGQGSVLFGHHLGEPHVMVVIMSVCKGGCWRGWVLPAWADILQHQECLPDEQRCWRASAPRETESRSWKLEGKPCFVLAERNRRNKSLILLTLQLQL